MYGLTSDDCALLILYSTFVYGTFGSLRKIFATKTTLAGFVVILTLCETVVAFSAWASFGFPRDSMAISDFFLILSGGVFSLFGEYLYFACCSYLYVSTATGASMLVQSTLGVYLTFMVDSTSVISTYLSIGVGLSVLGLGFIIAAESFTSSDKSRIRNNDESHESEPFVAIAGENELEIKTNAFDLHHLFWLFVACISGLMMTGLGILSAIEETSDSGTQNPAQLNLIYQAGQLLGVPMAVFLFSYLEVLGHVGYHVVDISTMWEDYRQMATNELYWTIAMGLFSGTGSLAYYFGILSVPYSVSYAITTCQVLIATICSVIVFQEFQSMEMCSLSSWSLIAGCITYSVALYVLLDMAF